MILEILFTKRHTRPDEHLARVLDAEPDAGEPDLAVSSEVHPSNLVLAALDDETWFLEYDV